MQLDLSSRILKDVVDTLSLSLVRLSNEDNWVREFGEPPLEGQWSLQSSIRDSQTRLHCNEFLMQAIKRKAKSRVYSVSFFNDYTDATHQDIIKVVESAKRRATIYFYIKRIYEIVTGY